MSQAKPVDQDNRSGRSVVLLAVDRSQSIIGEIVKGQTNTIGYSAYGEQSAQQKVETRLGFNGQLREINIRWYLLGNGYRAYNPRLMRFHSPDSWSPFGGGGLNAYMYCVGDPINRFDPTGHYWDWLTVKKLIQNLIPGNSHFTAPKPQPRAQHRTVNLNNRSGSSDDSSTALHAGSSSTSTPPSISPSKPSFSTSPPDRHNTGIGRRYDISPLGKEHLQREARDRNPPPFDPLPEHLSSLPEPSSRRSSFSSLSSSSSSDSSYSRRSRQSGDPSDWSLSGSDPSLGSSQLQEYGALVRKSDGAVVPGWTSRR
ncbi:hypothetical protein D3C87_1307570 [compost metagenome]|uniref:RHS repeat-associated core domain-containing protein n=1 Tax=Pseudomonas sp. MAG733B TaxID=3122079 RepID=UPI000FBF3246